MDYATSDVPPKQVVQALELAVAALRAGGTDTNVPTMQAGQPLTLEQLRGMDGRCVKVIVDGIEQLEMLALVEVPEDEDCVLLRNNLGGASEFYSNDDLKDACVNVYSYSPANIDREAWEPCDVCGKADNGITATYSTEDMQGFTSTIRHINASYCPKCGRPRTKEAWAELEKRVRGE